ncbi:uncharacterized protein CC84DRAFT_1161888 [Paraphaeosphaeria sporulosa]|uniref:Uncharacterized protein n=1 Tax=Paraphaeosphaeria sporulosa TaxID=1460663 RepID=A0A177CJW5_9PLEO|nr:uncharacterized protein CC84DRAFT_1161888 [Paraphaeosphaeria sporulosa]OAG07815.1 hypothetical protein CC84DRAFT_1161888 [Paraphaeosphaeria sporulosa]
MAFASLGVAVAEPAIAIGETSILFTVTDQAQYDQVTKDVLQAMSSYQASITAQPAWSSAYSQLVEFQKTHKGVPAALTDLSTVVQYTATPSWYTAMPSDLQQYLKKEDEARLEFLEDTVEDAMKGSAARPIDIGVYVHGAVATLIAIIAIAL